MSQSRSTTTLHSESNKEWIRGVVFTALFSAMFIAATLIKIPIGFTPIPLSLASFAIMITGGLLGARYGFLSIFIVVVLTAAGLPLIGGTGGLTKIIGPSGGYVWMYPIAALLIGLVSDKLFSSSRKLTKQKKLLLFVTLFTFGALLLYSTGVPWLAYTTNHTDYDTLSGALAAGLYPFLPGDLIKSLAATVVITAIRPILPSLPSLRKPS